MLSLKDTTEGSGDRELREVGILGVERMAQGTREDLSAGAGQ